MTSDHPDYGAPSPWARPSRVDPSGGPDSSTAGSSGGSGAGGSGARWPAAPPTANPYAVPVATNPYETAGAPAGGLVPYAPAPYPPAPGAAGPYAPYPPGAYPPPGFYGPYTRAPEQNQKALIALILGIVALVLTFAYIGAAVGIVAIVLGVMGRREIDADPARYSGRSLATAGFVMGIVSAAIGVLLITFVILAVALS